MRNGKPRAVGLDLPFYSFDRIKHLRINDPTSRIFSCLWQLLIYMIHAVSSIAECEEYSN